MAEETKVEDWRVQLSIKAGENMLNVRGATAGELLGELDTLANLSGEVDSCVTAIKAMECLKSGVQSGANSYGGGTSQGGAGSSGGYQAGGQNTAGRGCIHGPMTYREGTGARGPWKGWFCPEPKGSPNACKAVFQNG